MRNYISDICIMFQPVSKKSLLKINSLFHNLVYKWFITLTTINIETKKCGPIKSKTSKATWLNLNHNNTLCN